MAAYSPAARPVMTVLAYQGLRTQEALRLDWRHVQWGKRSLYVARSKSGRPRTVPMHRRVRVCLYRLWVRHGRPAAGPVFLSSRGEPVYIQASYCPIKDRRGRVVAVVKYAADISIPTRKTNEALARTQAIISFSLDGIVTEVNDTFLSALGYSRDEVVGHHHRMFCDKEYASSPQYAEFWQKLSRGEPQVGEFERIRKDGRAIVIQAAYNPTFDLAGNAVGVTKYATDITHAKEVKREADSMAFISACTAGHEP